MMGEGKVTDAEIKRLIQLLEKTKLFETNEDVRNYIEIINQKLEK